MAEESSNKKKKFSKNKKKTWRKHTDIIDVEEFLEDRRLQERTGGIVADKLDGELFFVDKDVPIDIDVSAVESAADLSSNVKPLRCHSLLLPDPNTKAARVAHNVRKKIENKALCRGKMVNAIKGVVRKVDVVAREHSKEALKSSQAKRCVRNKVETVTYDLWDDNNKVESEDFHFTVVTKKRRVNVPSHYTDKPSVVKSVPLPHAGTSYNPTLESYTNLMVKAHNVELIKEKKEQQITRALDNMFPDKKDAPTEQTYLQEMSVGLFDDEDENVDGADGEEQVERLTANPPVRREDKKTVTQRNKEKRQKDELKQAKRKKLENVQAAINRLGLRAMKRHVAGTARRQAQRAAHRLAVKQRFLHKPKKLGAMRFEQPEIPVKLVDELEGSLRRLKPEGNLLEDRFKSLQERNIIEVRKRAKGSKLKRPKVFEKKSFKEITA